jgi:site-specific DNA-adenine methylase
MGLEQGALGLTRKTENYFNGKVGTRRTYHAIPFYPQMLARKLRRLAAVAQSVQFSCGLFVWVENPSSNYLTRSPSLYRLCSQNCM